MTTTTVNAALAQDLQQVAHEQVEELFDIEALLKSIELGIDHAREAAATPGGDVQAELAAVSRVVRMAADRIGGTISALSAHV